MEQIDFESITIRKEISSRGGGIEIALDTLGFKGVKMTAYQNYLGGGMLGRVMSSCNVNYADERMNEIEEQLRHYFFDLTNPDTEWEHQEYEVNKFTPICAC